MISRTEQTRGKPGLTGHTWFWGLAALLVCLVAITRQSLWIDELLTAHKALQPSLHNWWQTMLNDRASDAQMPLYMFYIWVWAHIVGGSEWALRTANAPFFVAGIIALGQGMRRKQSSVFMAVVLLSPFAWYYLDEARPYAMQCGASLMIFGALSRLGKADESNSDDLRSAYITFLFGVVFLAGSSLLGMIWSVGACFILAGLVQINRILSIIRSHWISSLIAAFVLLLMGFYYLWTLQAGARASDLGRTDTRNIVFIAYELFGFSGLGPGRLQIRNDGVNAFFPYAIPLILYGVLILYLVVLGGWNLCESVGSRRAWLIVLAIMVPTGVIIAAGYVKHFRILGRHFAPLLPIAILLLGSGLLACGRKDNCFSKAVLYTFMIFSFISCGSVRNSLRHQKDDYRDAAAIAKAAINSGRQVWWLAAPEGAEYYGIPIAGQKGTVGVICMVNPVAKTLAGLENPDLIVLSKPEIFDSFGTVTARLNDNKTNKVRVLPAFTLWETR